MEDKVLDARNSAVLVHMAGRVGRKEKKHDVWDILVEDAASLPGTLGASRVRIAH